MSKTWRTIIDDPDFAKLQFGRRSRKADGNYDDAKVLGIVTDTGKLYSVGFSSFNCDQGRRTKNILLRSVDMAFTMPYFPKPECGGLVVISKLDEDDQVWSLFNVCTGECLTLPSVEGERMYEDGHFRGIGYDSSREDYKVVNVSSSRNISGDLVIKAWVYSLKSNDWHRVEDFVSRRHVISCIGVFANGALHWAGSGDDALCIIALDLKTETYRTLPLPAESVDARMWKERKFDQVGGCLMVSAVGEVNNVFMVWILQNYGGGGEGDATWVKIVSLTAPPRCDIEDMEVIAYMKATQEVIILYKNYKLLWFDVTKQKCIKKVTNMGRDGPFSYQVLPSSIMKKSVNETLSLKLRIPGASVPWYE